MFKNPTEVWEDQMNDLFLTKKVKNTDKVIEALSIILCKDYGKKNKELLDLYNYKGIDEFIDIISLFERKTVTFPSKDEIKDAVKLAIVFYFREVEGYSWEKIKSTVPFELSSISYSFKLKSLNKFIVEQLFSTFESNKKEISNE